MKFLCPSCKAKYQIADEKVAGRSVRMKCRKCGHMISISKAVTEGSVSRKLEAAGSAPPPPPEPTPASSSSASRSAPKPPRAPAEKSASWKEPGAAVPARPAPPRAAPPPRPGAPRPPPRPASSPLAASGPRAAEQKAPSPAPPPARSAIRATAAAAASEVDVSPQSSSATPSPAAARSSNGNGTGNGAAAQAFRSFARDAGLVSYEAEEDEQTQIASVGALAGAFSQAVRAPDSSSIISTPADEWYVGINGVPVGPIRLSELRSKASVGAITLDSLVWREGFEEWQPLRTFPELIAIVEEGLSSARASLSPLSPPTTSHTPPIAAVAALSAQVPPAPAPLTGVGVLSDPFAAPPASAPVPGVERSDLSELGLVPPRKGTGAAAWIAVVVALLFGLTIGFVLFSRQSAEPIVKIVEVPAKTETTAAPSAAAEGPTGPAEVDVAGDPGSKTARVGGPLPKSGDPKEPEKAGTGMTGLKGLSALQGGGPQGGPSGSGATGPSGGQLDSTQVQQTVSRYTASVKRSCWQPAIDTRAKDAPSSARVAVTITVAPSGSVQNVSTSGDPKGYRGLAGCIASRVKGWQFPASSGTTTVNVPFYFAAQ